MIHEVLPVGPLQCNCSILGDETTKDAIVVDPGDQIDEIVAILERHQLKVKAIVITHAHLDHIGGATKLKRLTGAPVLLNQRDSELLGMLAEQAAWIGMDEPDEVDIDQDLRDGETLKMGETALHVLHTPGHTQGSTCLWIPSETRLIAGDTLFRDSIGRTDLPGGNMRQILQSIHQKLLVLPEETVVIPGHGPVTQIAREKDRNPFLQDA